MNYLTYTAYSPHQPTQSSFYRSAEVAIGALLLISPMLWLFIAELVK